MSGTNGLHGCAGLGWGQGQGAADAGRPGCATAGQPPDLASCAAPPSSPPRLSTPSPTRAAAAAKEQEKALPKMKRVGTRGELNGYKAAHSMLL